MTDITAAPVAQYLRVSTEHQQYSLENQSSAIQRYAEAHNFGVIQTYSDAAKSGIVLKRRTGLQQLLQDVVSGTALYRAILVYDVSRWGRFQDTDEAAHYEFLCKSAGVPVHYCAETFTNDGSLSSLIMKTLKRTMAAEYSRELGAKVTEGMNRLTMLGFKQGGVPGYGLRRMLISASGVRKLELAFRERKSISTDRVILVPGPPNEVLIVKEIYRMFISEKRTTCAIARKLNADGVPRPGHSKWDISAIRIILTNPKYAGCSVHGQTTGKLYTPRVRVPRSKWIVRPGAFEAIIDPVTFAQAQRMYSRWNSTATKEELLEDLRALLASAGRLSTALIRRSPRIATPSTYCLRFGSLQNAYKLIGYDNPRQFMCVKTRNLTASMREGLIVQIAKALPSDVSIIHSANRWRSRLRLSNGLIVCVLVARSVKVVKQNLRWRVYSIQRERKFITLLVRLNASNTSILDMFVFPDTDRKDRFEFRVNHPWLNRGKRLSRLSQLCEVVTQLVRARSATRRSPLSKQE
ncbi:MAG TPA: recombinase family protein [Candidatus Acidoferrales bacterium]|nr:recombinase family protein [Candidatus Acidoferrales bacterium]